MELFGALQDTLRLYQNKIDGITIAAAVTKLVRSQRYVPEAHDAQLSTALMAWMTPFLQFQLRYSNTRTLVALLWAWASLAPGPVSL
jgi:hypothetical protein